MMRDFLVDQNFRSYVKLWKAFNYEDTYVRHIDD